MNARFQDTPAAYFLRLLADLMGVQLLFILCSLPLITIGPALSAMYAVIFRRQQDEGIVAVIPTFFHAFKQNFLSSLALMGIELVIGGIAVGDLWFATHSDAPVSTLYMTVADIVGILALVLFILTFAQQSIYRNSITAYLKNSLALAVCAPLQLIGSIAAWAFPWLLIAIEPEVFTRFGILHLLWGFSFPVWVTVRLFLPIFLKTGGNTR